MTIDSYAYKVIRKAHLLGESIPEIWQRMCKFNDNPFSYPEQLVGTIAGMLIHSEEVKIRDEILFLKEQLKLRQEYLNLSWEITEAATKKDEQEDLLKLKQHEIKKIKLVPFEEIL